jgi:hypothetical protein
MPSPVGTKPVLVCQWEVAVVFFAAGKADCGQDFLANKWDAPVTGSETIEEEGAGSRGVLIGRTCELADMEWCGHAFSSGANHQFDHRQLEISPSTHWAGMRARQSMNFGYPKSADANMLA